MADTGAITLALAAANDLLVEGAGVRFAAETQLGITKLQILVANPDAWFEQALGIKPPSALTEIEPGPVAIAWLAPGEWLVTGDAADVERVRTRCASKRVSCMSAQTPTARRCRRTLASALLWRRRSTISSAAARR
ncbi:sarcosine oxidase subunit gamma family protein [Sphingopyxis fribergensis]